MYTLRRISYTTKFDEYTVTLRYKVSLVYTYLNLETQLYRSF